MHFVFIGKMVFSDNNHNKSETDIKISKKKFLLIFYKFLFFFNEFFGTV